MFLFINYHNYIWRFPGDRHLKQMNYLVICIPEMVIVFVLTISDLSLADEPSFKMAPIGSPLDAAVPRKFWF